MPKKSSMSIASSYKDTSEHLDADQMSPDENRNRRRKCQHNNRSNNCTRGQNVPEKSKKRTKLNSQHSGFRSSHASSDWGLTSNTSCRRSQMNQRESNTSLQTSISIDIQDETETINSVVNEPKESAEERDVTIKSNEMALINYTGKTVRDISASSSHCKDSSDEDSMQPCDTNNVSLSLDLRNPINTGDVSQGEVQSPEVPSEEQCPDRGDYQHPPTRRTQFRQSRNRKTSQRYKPY